MTLHHKSPLLDDLLPTVHFAVTDVLNPGGVIFRVNETRQDSLDIADLVCNKLERLLYSRKAPIVQPLFTPAQIKEAVKAWASQVNEVTVRKPLRRMSAARTSFWSPWNLRRSGGASPGTSGLRLKSRPGRDRRVRYSDLIARADAGGTPS